MSGTNLSGLCGAQRTWMVRGIPAGTLGETEGTWILRNAFFPCRVCLHTILRVRTYTPEEENAMSRKAMFVGLVAVVLAMAAPSFAQGPFADVPVDHWAYEAVSQLQEKGIIIGYPDGTFGGKRAMTRYEFALALSRAMPVICDMCQTQPVNLSGYATKQELQDAIKGITPGGGPSPVSAADMDALKKSVNEFRDELSGMGVDLDAVKRDVASLEERVAAIEAEMKRLKITTKLNFFAIADKTREAGYTMMPSENGYSNGYGGYAYDRDSRVMNATDNLLGNIAMVRDADVIFNFQGGDTRAKVVLNAGNYLGEYLGGYLTDFVGDGRSDNSDDVNLFMAYGEMPFLGADVTVGRFPIQFTKWTLKKFDVDSYTENWKTDDGNYYVDGIKGAWNWGSVDILAFAGKNNGNGGAYTLSSRPAIARPFGVGDQWGTAIGMIPGQEDGYLGYPAVQSIGARAAFNLGSMKLGANWISASPTYNDSNVYDRADVYGADLEIPLGSWKMTGAYTISDTKMGPSGSADLDDDNDAWEAGLCGNLGSLGLWANYKDVAPNFSAPGDWGRLGRWQNPVDIKGPSVGMKWAAGDRWSLSASGSFFEFAEDSFAEVDGGTWGYGPLDDWKVETYKGAINVAIGAKGAIGLEGEWVKWKPTGSGGDPMETYYTLSYNHLVSDNAKLRLLYQIVEYKDKDAGYRSPYGSSYKGDVAVAQVSMDF